MRSSILMLATAAALFAQAYQKWLAEDVAYIIKPEERQAFQRLSSDEERSRFVERFWALRDPTPGTPANEAKQEHYRRIADVNERLGTARRTEAGNNTAFAISVPGWRTDRGRAYIILGAPTEIESHPSPRDAGAPYEIWRFTQLEGIEGTVELRFVDQQMTGNYVLIEADPAIREALQPK